jgi:hypothetical protein
MRWLSNPGTSIAIVPCSGILRRCREQPQGAIDKVPVCRRDDDRSSKADRPAKLLGARAAFVM